jgi:small basic protein (TIGR04137 family)
MIPIRYSWLDGKGIAVSIDKSLRRKNTLARSRNVLTRGERILVLQGEERWPAAGRSPYGLPKVRVAKLKKGKKAAKEEKTEEAAAAPAATDKKEAKKK